MSNNRHPDKILNWVNGLNPIDEEMKISYSNQNGVTHQSHIKYSLNDMNGYSQKDDEIFNITRMN